MYFVPAGMVRPDQRQMVSDIVKAGGIRRNPLASFTIAHTHSPLLCHTFEHTHCLATTLYHERPSRATLGAPQRHRQKTLVGSAKPHQGFPGVSMESLRRWRDPVSWAHRRYAVLPAHGWSQHRPRLFPNPSDWLFHAVRRKAECRVK
jgi:hypothetical protein